MKPQSKFRALLDEAIKEAQYEILTKVEDELTERANMMFELLVSEEGRHIWTNANDDVFWKMSSKRDEVRIKSNTYAELSWRINRMKINL